MVRIIYHFVGLDAQSAASGSCPAPLLTPPGGPRDQRQDHQGRQRAGENGICLRPSVFPKHHAKEPKIMDGMLNNVSVVNSMAFHQTPRPGVPFADRRPDSTGCCDQQRDHHNASVFANIAIFQRCLVALVTVVRNRQLMFGIPVQTHSP